MSEVKQLLDSLLWDIYGKQQLQQKHPFSRCPKEAPKLLVMSTSMLEFGYSVANLQRLSVRKLIDICAILKVELRLMSYFLEKVLINRDRHQRHQEILCGFVDAILNMEYYNAHPKMRFSLSPPPPKAIASFITSPTNATTTMSATRASNNNNGTATSGAKSSADEEAAAAMTDDSASDYTQWLHAMKLVARLPGGMPPEFRRKLWLSLADKYLKSKNVDWSKEEEKCFCEKWREDDEELGIQIVKDLHRTGSNLCTGPAGSINQAKLKRILLGYARYNPEVGYCQGFNMLGALILQVMEKDETESMKVMIYLVEGVLPPGYFCGSMGGLQADMGVFRELMQTKLPRLAKHLQKLQGPIENAYEPPLTNVFTMQWFLTLFCTCLPMSCVLRVWDLVLIEGSDVLLRTALVLWSLLEERVLSTRTADDFYGKMGSFSSELLNGHLIDSNGLIEKVVQLGPIPDIQKLRDKHLYNITPLRHNQGLQLYFDDEEPESDEESRLAVATVWGLPWGRRGSQTASAKQATPESKDRIALDISLLKKQYDRLRERQKQAHIILTTACTTARQGGAAANNANPPVPVNQLLMGRSAIVTNKGRRVGPPLGAIPPARKPSLPAVLQSIRPPEKQLRRGETLHWRDTDLTKRRRDSLTWKEIKADRATLVREDSEAVQSQKLRTRMGKSDSSSYSEESDDDEDERNSSTDTSLCDEDDPNSTGDKTRSSSIENSPKRRAKSKRKQKELAIKLQTLTEPRDSSQERKRPKSWAPSSNEIPFMLMHSPGHSGDERIAEEDVQNYEELTKEDSATECDRAAFKRTDKVDWSDTKYSPIAGDLAAPKLGPLHVQTDVLKPPAITSTSQLSPMPDITKYLNNSTISPLPTPKPLFLDSTNSLGSGDGDGDDKRKFDVNDDGVTNQYFERVNSVERPTKLDLFYSLNEEDSIRNAYEDNGEEDSAEASVPKSAEPTYKTEFKFKPDVESNLIEDVATEEKMDASHDRRMELLMDYSEKSSAAFIAEATSELSTNLTKELKKRESSEEILKIDAPVEDLSEAGNMKEENSDNFEQEPQSKASLERPLNQTVLLGRKHSLSTVNKKRRDPRRLTLTGSLTAELEESLQAKLKQFNAENVQPRTVEDNTKVLPKRIPTTEDLEARFNTLEKQLSIGKSSKNGTDENARRMSTSLEKTEDLEARFSALEKQHSIGKASKNGEDENVRRMSTSLDKPEDLEKRYNSLEKQLSTSRGSNNGAAENARRMSRSLEKTEDLEERYNAFEKQLSISEVTKNVAVEDARKMYTSPEKTEDLEARYNALEKQHSIGKASENGADENVRRMSTSLEETEDTEARSNTLEKQLSVGKASKNGEDENARRMSTSLEKTEDLEARYYRLEKQLSTRRSDNGADEVARRMSTSPEKTEDLEARYNALEKQHSIGKARKNGADENVRRMSTSLEKTEDLEAKHNALEKQLSISKASKNGTDTNARKISTSPEKIASNSTANDADESKPPRKQSRIPSTADLEDRFNALERQMSSHNLTKKNSVDLSGNGSKSTDDKPQTSRNASKENESTDSESVATNTDGKSEAKEETSATPSEEDKARLKKLPSTAELEDRFNALERKKSIPKTSPPQTKKEPPDGCEDTRRASLAEHMEEKDKNEDNDIRKPTSQDKKEVSGKRHNDKVEKATKENSKAEDSETEDKPAKTNARRGSPDQQSEEKIEKEKQKNSLKSFEEKCKTIDKQLTETAEKQKREERTVATSPKGTNTKSKTPEEAENRSTSDEPDEKPKRSAERQDEKQLAKSNETVHTETGKRRASEPPTTEDLEKRFESLKRRMSSKTIVERELTRSETVEEAMERIEKEITEVDIETDEPTIAEVSTTPAEPSSPIKSKSIERRKASAPPSTEDLESRFEALQAAKRKASAPPSTEDLESRFEALHRRATANRAEKRESPKESKSSTESPTRAEERRKSKSTETEEVTKIKTEDENLTSSKSKSEKSNSSKEMKSPKLSPPTEERRKSKSTETEEERRESKAIVTGEERRKSISAKAEEERRKSKTTEAEEERRKSKTAEAEEERRKSKTTETDEERRRSTSAEAEEERRKSMSAKAEEERRKSKSAKAEEERRKSKTAEAEEERRKSKSAEADEQRRKSKSAEADEQRRKNKSTETEEDVEIKIEAEKKPVDKRKESVAKHLQKRSPPEEEKETQTDDLPSTAPSKAKEENPLEKKQNTSNIPDAPPMPEPPEIAVGGPNQNQRRALIEEFQSKIKSQPSDENLKPSDINPNRKIPTPTADRPTSKADETSEAHADTAFYRSENYEPWQTHPRKMVRRFSDLPSRADLENRLEFLEKQLIKKLYKQRCASDSEVTSRRYFTETHRKPDDDKPSTSKATQQSPEDLEKRVQALEKQLSENSLKLLEAMRVRTQKISSANSSPRKLSNETIDATGKELVRYTHVGELEECEMHKPINISINIKMLLNKDDKQKDEKLPSTEELEKRLESLELQLKSKKLDNFIVVTTEKTSVEIKPDAKPEETEKVEAKKDMPPEAIEKESEKAKKDIANAEFKADNREPNVPKVDDIRRVEAKPAVEDVQRSEPKKEATKEDKTLENTEIARSTKCKEEKEKKEEEAPKSNTTIKRDAEELKESMSVNQLEQKSNAESKITSDKSAESQQKVDETKDLQPEDATDNMVINAADIGPTDPKDKTLVLLLDNEPKAVKVRRLTRANTEELEDLFQALERQISNRNLVKSDDGKLTHSQVDKVQTSEIPKPTAEAKAISHLTKEIEEFTSVEKKPKVVEDYDWGPDPIKRHLKRKTVHLPSTKELESRFRSLERQIKLLEDVEAIDVEQRLGEIERKIKLQYSLSHEKDLSKFLELCEGKGLDEMPDAISSAQERGELARSTHNSPTRGRPKTPPSPKRSSRSPYTSPSRQASQRSPYTSPPRQASQRSPYTSPPRQARKRSPYSSPARRQAANREPIHPLEMLLDSSPDTSDIPLTGELEHRMRILDGKHTTPSPPRQPRQRSPTIEDIKQRKLAEEQMPRTPIHDLETLVSSPVKREPPTADELEARMRALEKEQCFDFKMQKNFRDFKQKLQDVISPSLSFEEFKASKSREESPRRSEGHRSTTPKSALRDADNDEKHAEHHYRSTSPKVIRFQDDEVEEYRPKSRTSHRSTERMVGTTNGVLETIEENSKMLHRILKQTLADSSSSYSGAAATPCAEGLEVRAPRLMRETSPIQRTGTHTGIPLRTHDNINERLTSIKNTIKSIDSLCEEKPYRKEKCQRYIDSLFSDSTHFSDSRGRYEYTPAIRVSDHSQRPSEHYLSRSMGSADSIRSTSPLRAASPLHHRSNRDLRRETSPRRRREEEREEYESRVRRANMLPNLFFDNPSALSSGSLIKFHKVDRQLDTYKYDERDRSSSRSASRSPLMSPYGSRETMMMHNNTTTTNNNYPSHTANTTTYPTTMTAHSSHLDLDRHVSPYRQTSHNLLGGDSAYRRSNTPVYNPGKLDIRHTTVTSTFYDRLLTEKQLEKQLTHPDSRSPLISPSVSARSYLDIPIASANADAKTSKENSPTAATAAGIESKYTPLPNLNTTTTILLPNPTTITTSYNSNIFTTTTTTNLTATTTTATQPYSAATVPPGNSSTFENASNLWLPTLGADASSSRMDLATSSCDNILMQFKSTTAGSVGVEGTTSAATAVTCASLANVAAILPISSYSFGATPATTSASAMVAMTTISNLANFNNPAITSFSSTLPPLPDFTASTFNPIIATDATATYSLPSFAPFMPLTIGQPSDMGLSMGLFTSSLNNNTNTGTSTGTSSSGVLPNELPKT